LPLKERTKTDYLAMVEAGRTNKTTGNPFANGPLHPLAEVSLAKITAGQIRGIYETEEAKSKRVAVYAMQVLRAVLNWHGVEIENSPLSTDTAGKERIRIGKTTGNPMPIPKDKLGAWWGAAKAMAGNVGADACRVILLTGCRPGEIFGSQTYKNGKTIVFATGLLVEQVDVRRKQLNLIDTKNRTNHTVHLSKQALEIVRSYCKGKAPTDKVFDVLDPGKTLEAINAAAEVDGITPHKLRHTFASVAAKLCSVFELKAMMNHAASGDVTADHYVDVDGTDLAVAWQRVADFIVDGKV
ncbi:MAG: tyrosine-type recombinase/integrase, partial [Candidatus Saccharibacteria bacterium]|nr:tyrosine-type recombinase/integrase [Rhodoferax sp.]